MDLDFSKQIKELLESKAAGRPGPKSGAQTPAEPHERKKGSDKNKEGSAANEKSYSKITFSEKVTNSLKEKVRKHNEKHSKKVTLGMLKKVYRRGAGAFSTSHRPGQTRGSWAMARVNMFLKMMRGGKVKESYRKADQDIAKASDQENSLASVDFWEYEDIELDLARIDLVKAGIDVWDQDQEAEELEYSEAQKKTLNKPFRLPKGSNKKFGVYVKNPKTGNVIMVKFGDPKMEIKRDDPARRRNFRARHKCDQAKDKTTPRYWSCKFWTKKPVSKMTSSEAVEWDDEEIVSEWGWDESSFAEQEEIFSENPDLKEVKHIVEEDEL